jgi:hypothetical protein
VESPCGYQEGGSLKMAVTYQLCANTKVLIDRVQTTMEQVSCVIFAVAYSSEHG